MDRAFDMLFFSFSSILLDLCSIKYPKTKTKLSHGLLLLTYKEQSQRLVTFETFDQGDQKT